MLVLKTITLRIKTSNGRTVMDDCRIDACCIKQSLTIMAIRTVHIAAPPIVF